MKQTDSGGRVKTGRDIKELFTLATWPPANPISGQRAELADTYDAREFAFTFEYTPTEATYKWVRYKGGYMLLGFDNTSGPTGSGGGGTVWNQFGGTMQFPRAGVWDFAFQAWFPGSTTNLWVGLGINAATPAAGSTNFGGAAGFKSYGELLTLAAGDVVKMYHKSDINGNGWRSGILTARPVKIS